jgi:hypothetical protein
LRYLADAEREITVPVGVVLSNQEEGRLWFRLPREEERIEGVSLSTAGPHLHMARVQIEAWLHDGKLPYATAPFAPLSAAWWEQVRRLMPWQVRLDPPRLVDCRDAQDEVQRLYKFWVRPSAPAEELVSPDGLAPVHEAEDRDTATKTTAVPTGPSE